MRFLFVLALLWAGVECAVVQIAVEWFYMNFWDNIRDENERRLAQSMSMGNIDIFNDDLGKLKTFLGHEKKQMAKRCLHVTWCPATMLYAIDHTKQPEDWKDEPDKFCFRATSAIAPGGRWRDCRNEVAMNMKRIRNSWRSVEDMIKRSTPPQTLMAAMPKEATQSSESIDHAQFNTFALPQNSTTHTLITQENSTETLTSQANYTDPAESESEPEPDPKSQEVHIPYY